MEKFPFLSAAQCFRFNEAFGAGIFFFFFSSSLSWKVSHSWNRELSAVCFSSLERDLGTLPTKPHGNGQFEEHSSPRHRKPKHMSLRLHSSSWWPKGWLAVLMSPKSRASSRPLHLTFDGREGGGRERVFQPPGPQPGPETPVVKAEQGCLEWLSVGPFIMGPWVGPGRACVSLPRVLACQDPAKLFPQSHPHPRGPQPQA